MINETPRVRFAPSPTGYLHVGGLRTALYNYLFAKHNNGKFILRIEDTDRNRYVEGAVDNLIKALDWAGLIYDEGPNVGGDYGPYMQSQRLEIYKKHADELISKGKAYYCFCTPERLTALKQKQEKRKLPQTKYDKHCLTLTKSEVEINLCKGIQHVVRLNIEPNQKIVFDDVIRERVEFDSNNIDDQILIKSDGYPTYHLANVVDDHLMKITHVIRGEEWLSSTPKHVLLYDSFGWERPVFAHLPLLLNPDRSKLSKRQGDVAVEDYRDKGYLKEALINFVALLGWNAGDDKEFYYLNELVDSFSLERVNKAGAVFDVVKLNSLNAEHLRKKSNEEILGLLKERIQETEYRSKNFSDKFLLLIIEAMKERVSFVHEFIDNCKYFYEPPTEYEQKAVEKNWTQETSYQLKKLIKAFEKITVAKRIAKVKRLREELKQNNYQKDNLDLIKDGELYNYKLIMKNNNAKLVDNKLVIGFLRNVFEFFEFDEENTLMRLVVNLSNIYQLRDIEKVISEYFSNKIIEKEDYEQALTKVAEELGVGKGRLIHPLRLAVSGQSTGPGMFDLLYILGKDEVIERINCAIAKLK